MDQVLLSVALPIVCRSRFNGTTHMRLYHIWGHIITMQNLLRAQYNIWKTLTHCVHWCTNTILCHISVVLIEWRTHYSKAHICDWHTIVEVYYSVTQYSQAHHSMAHWRPNYCGTHFHTGHTSTLLWGTSILGQASSHPGRGGAPSPVLEIHTQSYHHRPCHPFKLTQKFFIWTTME